MKIVKAKRENLGASLAYAVKKAVVGISFSGDSFSLNTPYR
jgi:hypothetical protein